MYVVICIDEINHKTISTFADQDDALDCIKRLAEKGAKNIKLAKEVEFEIEMKVNVRLV